jgi:hypothetical protein
MRALRTPSVIALSLLALAIPAVAHAGDDASDAKAPLAGGCEGWFCDDGGSDAKAPPATGTPSDATPDTSGAASAIGKDGAIMLPGGIEIPGRILEMVPGDHVTLQLGDGSKQSIPWIGIAGIRISAKLVIGGGASTTATTPAPAPTAAPPVVIYPTPAATPPPAPAPRTPRYVVDRPRPHRAQKPAFEPAFTLGGRFSLIAPGDSMGTLIGAGAGIEVQAGYRFARNWRFYGAIERASFEAGHGSSLSSGGSATFLGAGLELNFAPDSSIGYIVDVAMGFRSLDVPYTTGGYYGTSTATATYSGFEPLRLTAGITFPITRGLRMDLLAFADFGTLTTVKADGVTCASSNYDSSNVCSAVSDSSNVHQSYETVGLAIGGHFEL